ncbi:unnamed protein product [Thlaspi arvense]|uniref:Uncharacterized protein n=1 Tax=Thlaspi arvense TaxID=13288 RepID=A0AAU9SWF2_THLAR|nr:unnamed protein product [Thlaspi arvense]
MTTTQSSKPPLGNCNPSVPAWEKEFCAVVGSVPWKKVVEAKRFMHLYDRVVQWDDSAGEDAFKNAKSRYWAEINGVPCGLSLPDPDVYIDDVDWDAEVDTELILDLERGPDPITGEEEHVVILDALVLSGQYSGLGWGTGWGDAEGINEDSFDKPENSWGDQKCEVKEKTGSWGHRNNDNSFKTESWDHKKNDNSFKTESWDHKYSKNNSFKIESWDHKNNENSFKTESCEYHKYSNNNSFNYKRVGNWNCKDQGKESREWRKRGEVPSGGVRVEDCRWRNGRGRSRGGFQQYSNGCGWTESF